MRILIIGAGVTGSLFTSLLVAAKDKIEKKTKEKFEINLLARGKTYKQIEENGLKINHYLQKIITIDKISVIKELESNDKYDYVLIFLRKTQIMSILPILSGNKSRFFVFLGNNALGFDEYKKFINIRKIILGFPGSGGKKEDDIIHSIHKDKPEITMGTAMGKSNKPILKLKKVLKHASVSVKINKNIDSWLKYHIAIISPIANAICYDGGDNYSLSKNNNALSITVKAIREGVLALKSLQYPVEPQKLKVMIKSPDRIVKRKLKKLLSSEMGKLSLYDHSQAAPEEMRKMAEEFQEIIKDSKVDTENLNRLYTY